MLKFKKQSVQNLLSILNFSLLAFFFTNQAIYPLDAIPKYQPRNVWNPAHSDQWVATDSLGRSLPTYHDVGATRQGKYVACFYFLWLGRHGEAGPYNISKILENHPEAFNDPNSECWGRMHEPHHWNESIFGYYVGEDESVLRKHAQMLGDAGVDVICFDVTNQLTYPESYRPLFKIFSEMQQAGNKVPKVAFLCPFWSPNKVVRELWRDVYSKDFCSDIWFHWKGKPLILADPDKLGSHIPLSSEGCVPIKLTNGSTLTQSFSIKERFNRLTFLSPTWKRKDAVVDIKLFDYSGKVVESFCSIAISDNNPYTVRFTKPLDPGSYTVELSKSQGLHVGWWAKEISGNNYVYEAQKLRSTPNVEWTGATINGQPAPYLFMLDADAYDPELEKILDFFTFRPSQPDYFTGPTKMDQWGWLEVYPQHCYYNSEGRLEEMCVSVAQNAVDGKLGVLSNPRACGRSYHNGLVQKPEKYNYHGMNFQEQWDRALKVDPEIIFITGWNEWIAGRFDVNAPFHGTTPVSFVDQFNNEFSRDCEPMKGGHSDCYYYQMIANIRRFKGVSRPETTRVSEITIDGLFNDWSQVTPVYYDTISDPVYRNCRGWGKDQHYINTTGRNDIIEARVSFDKENLFFYLKMDEPIKGTPDLDNWITLLLDVDENTETGINGNDYIVKTNGKNGCFELLAVQNNADQPNEVIVIQNSIDYKISKNELELKLPLSELRVDPQKPIFRFKWTDGVNVFGSVSGFTTDGDAAPNDRYYYRYVAP